MSRRVRGLSRNLALAATAVVVTFGALELAVRLVRLEVHDVMNERRKYDYLVFRDPAGGYMRHPAGGAFALQGVDVRFNSLGMRDDEPAAKRPGAFRVLCVGDSVTFGPGVAQDATYPARLRTLLGGDVEIVAAGVQGWNTVEEERFLAGNLDRLDPDLVVLLYVTNDNEPTEPWREAKPPPTRWSSRLLRTLVLRSRLFEWAVFLYKTRVVEVDGGAVAEIVEWKRRRAAEGPPFAPEEPGWLASRAALGRIVERVRARRARLAIFLWNLNDRAPAPTALARLREFGVETGVPVFDTLGFFAGRNPATLVNSPFVEPHPNAEGHALLAAGMARELTTAGLLSPPR